MSSIPNRLGRKQGRFTSDFEVNEIQAGLRGHQQAFGDEVDYYRFVREFSQMDDIYDEGTGLGKVFLGPIHVPAIRVVHLEGSTTNVDTGLYWNDELHVTLGWDMVAKVGLGKMDLSHQNYLRDRIVYDGKVFRVSNVQVLGQIQRRDVVVSIEATQVKPDELVNDAQFAAWAGNDLTNFPSTPLPSATGVVAIDVDGVPYLDTTGLIGKPVLFDTDNTPYFTR